MGASASVNSDSNSACTSHFTTSYRDTPENRAVFKVANQPSEVSKLSSPTSDTAGPNNISYMPSNKVVSCDTCDIAFTFFKRKKICKDCQRSFCSSCLPKPRSSLRQAGRQCTKCGIITSGKFTRQQLCAWKIKDMRCFLDVKKIPTAACKEKHELIDLLLLHFCLESQSVIENEQEAHDRLVGELAERMRDSSLYTISSPPLVRTEGESETSPDGHRTSSPSVTASSPTWQEAENAPPQQQDSVAGETEAREASSVGDNSTYFLNHHLHERQQREMREAMARLQGELFENQPDSRPGIQRASLDDLNTAEDSEKLTVKQLKEILVNNFVDYKGCCEKRELVDRVKRLWNETQSNKQKTAYVVATSTEKESSTVDNNGRDPEQDICKVCMDAAIDCILLECGHMITCTKCGKRLADCPICRQYITRVVHIFRS